MKPRRWLLWALVGCALVALLAALLSPREPVYQNRKLSEWLLREIGDRQLPILQISNNTYQTVHAIGSNGVPWLLKWGRYQTPTWRRKLFLSAQDKPWLKSLVEALDLGLTDKRQDLAFVSWLCLLHLGPEARSAIPELTQLLHTSKSQDYDAQWATAVLTAIWGGIGEAAVPSLEALAADPNPRARHAAVDCLGHMSKLGTNAVSAVAILVQHLKDPDPNVAAAAAASLGSLRLEPGLAIPALADALRDPDPRVETSAVNALGRYGEAARPAIPDLLAKLREPRSDCYAVSNALQHIAPDSFAPPTLGQLFPDPADTTLRP